MLEADSPSEVVQKKLVSNSRSKSWFLRGKQVNSPEYADVGVSKSGASPVHTGFSHLK